MSQDYTVQSLVNRNKPDKFGNSTFTVKFAEDERAVFASFKTPPNVGDKKFGDINDGEYGPRFKSQPRDGVPYADKQPGAAPAQSYGGGYSKEPKKSDNERSNDIRWGLCIKEANAYVIANRPDQDATNWSKEVIEYASALYLISSEPFPVETEVEVTPPVDPAHQDVLLDDSFSGSEPVDLGLIPF